MATKNDTGTEALILAAAESEFLEKGFSQTKTTEIARRAGVNQALVHYYFRSKENLFEKVFLSKANLLLDSFRGSVESEMPFMEKIRKRIEMHFDFIAAQPRLPLFVVNEMATNPERIAMVKTKIKSEFIPILEKMQQEFDVEIARGNIRATNPVDFVMSAVSLNIFPFISSPMLTLIMGLDSEGFKALMVRRREENVRIMLDSLRP